MNGFYSLLMIVIGSYLLLCSLFYKKNKIFDFLIQKSKLLWKDNVYIFYSIISVILIILGFLYAFEIL